MTEVRHDEFEKLVRLHAKALREMARRFTTDYDQCDDLLQSSLLRAFVNFDRFELGTNFLGWICTVMHNVFVNSKRTKFATNLHVSYSGSDRDWILNSIVEPELSFEEVFGDQVQKAMDTLTPEMLETVLAYDVEGAPDYELAERFGISKSTVRGRVHRARKLLMVELLEFGTEQGYVVGKDRCGAKFRVETKRRVTS